VRVLHVISDLGTYGAERFVSRLLAAFDDPGIDSAALTVLAPRGPRPVLTVPLFAADRRGHRDVAFVSRMIAAMRRWQPAVVHTHTHYGKYWGRIAAIAAGVPSIVHTEHNSEFGSPAVFRAFDLVLDPRTDAFVTFSAVQRARLVREGRIRPERIVVIPNGIPLPEPAGGARERARALLGAAPGERVVLHVGRLSPVKNQRLAIEALALTEAGVRLVLVGDGADRDSLEAAARACGVSERVVFAGYRDDAPALLAGADALAVTSRNEAMPLAVIEAMLAGTPVVSTPWTGAADMLGQGSYGVLAADFTPAAFARALRTVLDDQAATRRRIEHAAAFARAEYDIRTTVRRHADLYRSLSAETRAARPRITSARS
jgi:glycosyltransferase involved in cell wall biosynthesis